MFDGKDASPGSIEPFTSCNKALEQRRGAQRVPGLFADDEEEESKKDDREMARKT